jgi:hypothetical protein
MILAVAPSDLPPMGSAVSLTANFFELQASHSVAMPCDLVS